MQHHIGYNNTINNGGWEPYNWLRELGYNHIVYIYDLNEFEYGTELTSHIQSIFGQLKRIINSIYNAFDPENYIYFLKKLNLDIHQK